MSGTGTSSRTRALPYSCMRAAFISLSFPVLVRELAGCDQRRASADTGARNGPTHKRRRRAALTRMEYLPHPYRPSAGTFLPGRKLLENLVQQPSTATAASATAT